MSRIGIGWQLGTNFGWGLYGHEIAMALQTGGRHQPVLLRDPSAIDQDVLQKMVFAPVARRSEEVRARLARGKKHGVVNLAMPILHALGNNGYQAFTQDGPNYRGSSNHGLIFFENSCIDAAGRAAFSDYETLVAGSTWCRDLMLEAGLSNTVLGIQGIDPALFHPAPRHHYLRDRFVIFMGGKLEFRKGHDIGFEAIRRFRQRHPETALIGIWGRSWIQGLYFQQFRHGRAGLNLLDFVREDAVDWRTLFGHLDLPEGNALLFASVPHRMLANVIREADVALFPNRAEGGTNLVAMEAMACGVPTILSANTGHLDIIEEGACLPLRCQTPVSVDDPGFETSGWGESDVDEVLDRLETVYRDRAAARAVGEAGSRFIQRFSWRNQLRELFANLGLDE